jgi:hypothetical protein
MYLPTRFRHLKKKSCNKKALVFIKKAQKKIFVKERYAKNAKDQSSRPTFALLKPHSVSL